MCLPIPSQRVGNISLSPPCTTPPPPVPVGGTVPGCGGDGVLAGLRLFIKTCE